MVDVGYLAALLEGEGSLNIVHKFYKTSEKPQVRAVLSVEMSDPEPIEWVAKIWESKVTLAPPSTIGKKSMFRTVCPSKNIVEVLQIAYPKFKTQRAKLTALWMIGLRGTVTYDLFHYVPEKTRMFREALLHATQAVNGR